MSDLPDEVLIDRRMHAWRPEDWHVLDRREGQARYVRAKLYEQAQHERDALADNQSCIACGGTGVDVEYGDYGAWLGSDWCDSCEAGKALRELDERAEQAEATLAEMCDKAETFVRRAEQAEADRDRLRAVLERAREMAEDGKTSACAMQVCEDIELIAQEALAHD